MKPTRCAANITGGLLFGVRLGLLGYCPGTAAATLGQGNHDAIPGIVGLMVGSYLSAETSDYLSATMQRIGNRGRIMLPDPIGMRVTVFLVIFVSLLVSGFFILQRLTPRGLAKRNVRFSSPPATPEYSFLVPWQAESHGAGGLPRLGGGGRGGRTARQLARRCYAPYRVANVIGNEQASTPIQ